VHFELQRITLESTETATLDALDRLLQRFCDAVHNLAIADGDSLEGSTWFYGLRPHLQELVRSQLMIATWSPPRITMKVASQLTLEAAVKLAYVPLTIVVEDDVSDEILLRVAIEAYASDETRRLWNLHPSTGPAVRVINGGGSGTERRTEKLIDEAAKAALPPRLVVMIDSDARWPAEMSKSAQSIADLCRKHDVSCVVLSCRNAESYIPDPLLRRWSEGANRDGAIPQVKALARLQPDQRDHFRMKGGSRKPGKERHGLREIDRDDAPSEQRSLYLAGEHPVSVDDLGLLEGFSDDIISILNDPRPTELRNSPWVTSDELDSRDRRGDLRKLVNLIEKAI
jgi:hypothetical protein